MSIANRLQKTVSEETKTLIVNAGTHSEPEETRWGLRYITQDVLDRIKARAMRRVGRGGEREVDVRVMNRLMLENGIAWGPEDWREDEDGKPVAWRGDAADLDVLEEAWQFSTYILEALQDFTNLDPEDRRGFR